MMGFQAEGAAPIVRGHPIENPETVAGFAVCPETHDRIFFRKALNAGCFDGDEDDLIVRQ